MIKTFVDRQTVRIFAGTKVQGMHPQLQRRARIKLQELDFASSLDDLGARRGNRLEKLQGDRNGQWSIRVDAQWRITWDGSDAYDVWFGDYH